MEGIYQNRLEPNQSWDLTSKYHYALIWSCQSNFPLEVCMCCLWVSLKVPFFLLAPSSSFHLMDVHCFAGYRGLLEWLPNNTILCRLKPVTPHDSVDVGPITLGPPHPLAYLNWIRHCASFIKTVSVVFKSCEVSLKGFEPS